MYLQNKRSIKADGVGDLYRCADKLAKNKIELGFNFYNLAKEKLGGMVKINLNEKKVFENHLYWAEMILDEYMRLKRLV